MVHLPVFIYDLSIILIAAGISIVLFRKLHLPVVLGYLFAGFLVSPYFPFLPTIAEVESVKVWAEMGVIFFLFSLGLEFSIKRLLNLGPSPFIIGFFEISFMFCIGFLTGNVLRWGFIDSLFLGGIISISSTTIIFKSLTELNLKSKKFSQNVFGVLIVEDIVAVLMLVLLSTIAITKSVQGEELIFSMAKLFFFLGVWLFIGLFIFPRFFRMLKHLLNDELILVTSLALCLGMVAFATYAGFSPALGAFIMGSILADTSEGKRIEHLFHPIKDLFGAVFFVSVGMLLNPQIIMEEATLILGLSLLVVLGKTFGVFWGSVIAGESISNSIKTGLSLAQIGEFSFIIATLGLSLHVLDPKIYPIVVSISIITTFLTPYLIKSGPKVVDFVETHLPNKMDSFFIKYYRYLQTTSGKSHIPLILTKFIRRFIPLLVIIVMFSVGGRKILHPFVREIFGRGSLATTLSFLITFILSSPFFWGLIKFELKEESLKKFSINHFFSIYLQTSFLFILISVQVSSFFYGLNAIIISLISTIFILFIFSSHLKIIYGWAENQLAQSIDMESAMKTNEGISLWDRHLTQLKVPPHSIIAGKTLNEISAGKKFGVMIAVIKREDQLLFTPDRDFQIFPSDTLGVLGSDEQIEQFKMMLEQNIVPQGKQESFEEYEVFQITINEDLGIAGKNIMDSGFKEKFQSIIIAVEREKTKIIHPSAQEILYLGDRLWVFGRRKNLISLP